MDRQGDWQERWSHLVLAIRIVRSVPEEMGLVLNLASGRATRVVGFVNAHAMNSVVANPGFYEALMNADILLRDGSGVAMLYRWLGREPGRNMAGTDFAAKILAAFRGRRVAFWGTQEPYLGAAAAHSEARFGVQVVSREHGFHDDAFYVALAAQLRPELILLGMGMPKQERVAYAIRSAVEGPSLILCGGAFIDFLGGKVRRAPQWMQMIGLEWMYRLMLEPRRLFRRYVIGNPLFLFRLRSWRTHFSEHEPEADGG